MKPTGAKLPGKRAEYHPRCQAKLGIEATRWRANRVSNFGAYAGHGPWDQCTNESSYRINGKFYCRKHAAYILLDIVFP